jgi:Outer membrane protein beta-barrel domain
MIKRIALLTCGAWLFAYVCSAQEGLQHFTFGAGAGFTMPTEHASDILNKGWNFNLRGGYNVSPQFAPTLDFTYTHSNLNSATLARLNEPNGDMGVWSLTFNPVFRFATSHSKVVPYFTAGYGIYHRNTTLSRPAIVQTFICDPFFGFCSPAFIGVNQTVASNSTVKPGANGGFGFEVPVGSRGVKIFAEARYHRIFTSLGRDVSYVPVTFGFHF